VASCEGGDVIISKDEKTDKLVCKSIQPTPEMEKQAREIIKKEGLIKVSL